MNNQIITTALDPNLLTTPFKIETKWHVLTGAACTGKITLIEQLAKLGFQIVPESARQYFEIEIAKGRTLEDIKADGANLQREIAALQLNLESKPPANEIVFLDRAIPDSLTFYRIFGLDPNEILPQCFYCRYAAIFILDRLPIQRDDPLGPEDNLTSNFLDKWLALDYTALGYEVVRVPPLSPGDRLDFLLESLTNKGV
jgi:predicted ATPase